MNKIKVIHILPSLGYGGIARMLYSFYEKMDHSRFEFYFIHFGEAVDYHENLRQMGGTIISIPPMRKAGFKQFRNQLKRTLQTECSDAHIIHIHLNYMSGLIAKWAKEVGIPHRICHIRGVLIEGKKRFLMPVYQYMIKKYCTDFLAVSRESGKFYYGKAFPFTVLNNGLDYQKFIRADQEEITRIKESCGLEKTDFIIAQVGRLSHEKNHAFSLSLVSALRKEQIPAVLLIAGEGAERQAIQEKAQQMGISQAVHLLGNRNDIQNIYHLCSVSVLPSMSEGMPNVVLQSQCAGKHCFLSDVITKDADLGLGLVHFCRLNDLNDWLVQIRDYLADAPSIVSESTIYSALKERGFLLEEEVKKLEQLYESMKQ